jgi:CRISPR/Cas system-associated exonuclease Cas4 (RecB family)
MLEMARAERDTAAMAIQHELSWSASRAGTFESCKRRYYFDYYLSWLGWGYSAEAPRKEAYLLKKMTRMPMLAGDLVHQAIEAWLKAKQKGAPMSSEAMMEFAVEGLREGYKTSRNGTWKTRPSKLVRLAEHHFNEPCIEETDGSAGDYGKRYVERMQQSIRNFLESPALAPAREADPAGYLACEEMSTFDFEGTKVYAIPDFAFRDASGTVHVYDWKTGRPNERDAFQLAVYVEYAVASWDVDPDDVVCYDAYLQQGEIVEQRLDAEERQAMRERMLDTMAAMRAVHFNADKGVGNVRDFPMVPDPGPGGFPCGSCNYRGVCKRG